jgi:alpha/beta superfamily hydrolase
LIRSRRHLATDAIATLIVDCHSGSGDYCSSSYQASLKRHQDVLKLIQEVKKQYPSIQQVWAIGTSMGTVSSSFALTHEPNIYAGAIHTASITEPNARNSYRELSNFDYAKANHIFIHHLNDPCYLTTHSGAKSIADKYELPLITVKGGGGFSGDACKAFTEHGFRGKEKEVMTAIGKILMTGRVEALLID